MFWVFLYLGWQLWNFFLPLESLEPGLAGTSHSSFPLLSVLAFRTTSTPSPHLQTAVNDHELTGASQGRVIIIITAHPSTSQFSRRRQDHFVWEYILYRALFRGRRSPPPRPNPLPAPAPPPVRGFPQGIRKSTLLLFFFFFYVEVCYVFIYFIFSCLEYYVYGKYMYMYI